MRRKSIPAMDVEIMATIQVPPSPDSLLHRIETMREQREEYAYQAFDCALMLLKTISRNLPVSEEIWHANYDGVSPSPTGIIRMGDHAERNAFRQRGNRGPYELWIKGVWPEDKDLGFAINCFNAKSEDGFASPIRKGEKLFNIQIAPKLWEKLDKEEVINTIKQIILRLGATYAAMDRSEMMFSGIYNANFRFFAADGLDIDPETRIPSVNWAQYISRRMSGMLRYDELREKLEGIARMEELGDGLWIQLEGDPDHTSREARLALRKCFEPSLYRLDLDKITRYRVNPIATISMELLPLTDEESISTMPHHK